MRVSVCAHLHFNDVVTYNDAYLGSTFVSISSVKCVHATTLGVPCLRVQNSLSKAASSPTPSAASVPLPNSSMMSRERLVAW